MSVTMKERTKLFSLAELPKKVRERVLDREREYISKCFMPDLDDMVTVAGYLGIYIFKLADTGYGEKSRGFLNPKINWTLSYCQGDGANFEGEWTSKYPYKTGAPTLTQELFDTNTCNSFEEAIKSYAPQDETLLSIAKDLDSVVNKDKIYENGDLTAVCSRNINAHYEHSGCIDVSVTLTYLVDSKDGQEFETTEDGSVALLPGVQDTIQTALRRFADWIHSQIQQDYEYQTSDETLTEQLANAKFTEDGEQVSD